LGLCDWIWFGAWLIFRRGCWILREAGLMMNDEMIDDLILCMFDNYLIDWE